MVFIHDYYVFENSKTTLLLMPPPHRVALSRGRSVRTQSDAATTTAVSHVLKRSLINRSFSDLCLPVNGSESSGDHYRSSKTNARGKYLKSPSVACQKRSLRLYCFRPLERAERTVHFPLVHRRPAARWTDSGVLAFAGHHDNKWPPGSRGRPGAMSER